MEKVGEEEKTKAHLKKKFKTSKRTLKLFTKKSFKMQEKYLSAQAKHCFDNFFNFQIKQDVFHSLNI